MRAHAKLLSPMSHLDFHVAVATAWCKSPKLVLEHEKPTREEARAAAEAAEPEQGGVRGERQRTSRAAAAAAGPTPGPQPARARSKSPSSGKAPYLTVNKLEKIKQSYTTSPELHTIEIPMLRPSGEVSECQICNTARGMRKPGERYQTMAHLRCKECNVNVCGAGCWQLLHGFYDTGEGKGEVLPCRAEVIEKAEDEEAVDEADDADGGDVADGENDDDDENM